VLTALFWHRVILSRDHPGLSFVGTTAKSHALTTTDDVIQPGYDEDTIPVDFET
jgi:hypothetical protein